MLNVSIAKIEPIEGTKSEKSLRPRIGRYNRAAAQTEKNLKEIRAFARQVRYQKSGKFLEKSGKARRHLAIGKGKAIPTPNKLAQRAVVKARYLKMNGKLSKGVSRAHLNYITRDSVGIDGGAAIAFNNEQYLNTKELNEFLDRGINSPHQFRLIVSPENGARLDIELFTKDLISQMEKDLDSKLDYVGVVHYDTDNPHVHLVINGKTDKGLELIINREYLSSGIRYRAGEVATKYLGLRTEQELQSSLEKEITAQSYTSLDLKLERLSGQEKESLQAINLEKTSAGGKKIVDLAFIPKKASISFIESRGNLLARLLELEKMELAYEAKPGVWVIDNNLREKLNTISKSKDLENTIKSHIKNISKYNEIVVINQDQQMSEEVIGKVVGRGIANELYDSKYVVVAGVDGNVYYSTLSRFSEKEGMAAMVGDIVTLDNRVERLVTAADRNALLLSEESGVYSLKEHRELMEGNRKDLPKEFNIDNFVAAHQKRMEYLEGKGLITVAGQGEWNIPKDLVDSIEKLGVDKDRKLFTRVNRILKSEVVNQLEYKDIVVINPKEEISKEITGKVIDKGVLNKEHGINYIAVAGVDGNVYYSQLSRFSEKEGMAAMVGNFVTLDNRVEKLFSGGADYNAVKFSGKSGVYSLDRHKELLLTGAVKLPKSLSINDVDDYIDRHRKRMEHLEGKGLIKKIDTDKWKVPSDLVQAVENSGLDKNKRLLMRVDLESVLSLDEQVKTRGLTAIDRHLIKNGEFAKNTGSTLTKEFNQALEERVKTLQSLGLATMEGGKMFIDKQLAEKLLDLEMNDIAKDLGNKYGQYKPFNELTYSSLEKVKKYEGTIAEEITAPSGKYTVVSSPRNYTILPSTDDMKKLSGKNVEIRMERNVSVNNLNKQLRRVRSLLMTLPKEQSKDFGLGL